MTPREIFALAVGILLGVLMQSHGADCNCRACRKKRWNAGESPEAPRTISSEAGRIIAAIDSGQTSYAKHLIIEAMVAEAPPKSKRRAFDIGVPGDILTRGEAEWIAKHGYHGAPEPEQRGPC